MFLRFKMRFESAHRFVLASSPKCQTPHGHTWWVTLEVGSKSSTLNDESMVVEFSKIKSVWRSFVDETVDHSFFYNSKDPLIESMQKHIPNFRGLEFPSDPTTELISALFFIKAEAILAGLPQTLRDQLFVQSIIIDETPTNSVVCDKSSLLLNSLRQKYRSDRAWWNCSDASARHMGDEL